MILIAVIVGYLLGIAPFIFMYFYKKKIEAKEEQKIQVENKEGKEIFNEWVYGREKEEILQNKFNQEDIFKEYTTGEIVNKQ